MSNETINSVASDSAISTPAQHTPGPWEARFDGSHQTMVCSQRGRRAVASTFILTDARCIEQNVANARLIAAAPDMLEALRQAEIVFRCETCDGSGTITTLEDELNECQACHANYSYITGRVRAAIAKATGGQ